MYSQHVWNEEKANGYRSCNSIDLNCHIYDNDYYVI